MIIVGDNLKALIKQYSIVDNINSSFDNTSISLRLDPTVIKIEPHKDAIFTYGDKLPDEWIKEERIKLDKGIILNPQEAILACSLEKIKIPIGYFGLLQTKGSLARLFVSIHCSDSQIEPGFEGKITFEICNFSNFKIRILPKQFVGDLFLFKASTRQVEPYDGRYNNSEKPTIQLPEK